jgi:hypothetical protein
VFFGARLSTINSPRFTTLPPHIYHQNTTPKTHFLRNPPQKRQQNSEKSTRTTPKYFSAN